MERNVDRLRADRKRHGRSLGRGWERLAVDRCRDVLEIVTDGGCGRCVADVGRSRRTRVDPILADRRRLFGLQGLVGSVKGSG